MTSAANAGDVQGARRFRRRAHAIPVLHRPSHAASASIEPDESRPGERPVAQDRRPRHRARLSGSLDARTPSSRDKDAKIIHIAHRSDFATLSLPRLRDRPAIAGRSLRGAAPCCATCSAHEAEGQERAPPTAPQARHGARAGAADSARSSIEAASTQRPISYAWVAHCVNQVKGANAIVVEELGVPLAVLDVRSQRAFMATSSGRPRLGPRRALGAKLAAPGPQVITTVGDGSYMFGCPPRAFRRRAENLPVADHGHQQFAVVRRAARHRRHVPGRARPPRPTACRSSTCRPRPTTRRSSRPSAATARRWTIPPSSRGLSAARSNRSRRAGRRP